MHRLIASLSALCLIGVIGCDKHVAGVCDCDIPGHSCCYGNCAWHHFAPGVQIEAIRPEAVPEKAKEMPKALPNKEEKKNIPADEKKNTPADEKNDGK